VSLIRYLLVQAAKSGKLNDIRSFFADFGEELMSGPDAQEWNSWFALPYVQSPASHPTFQVLPVPAGLHSAGIHCRSRLNHQHHAGPSVAVLCLMASTL
jgi:hypothetical protein